MFKLVCALLLCALPCFASPVDGTLTSSRPNPRLRPYDARAAALLLAGIERSQTIRLLAERLEQHNVVVYIDVQPGMKRHLAGRMVFLASTKSYRYVRISLNPELPNETLVSVLGHELRHALEVAEEPAIVDDASLEAYYKVHGINMRSHVSGWDTQAARDTGDMVRREIAHAPTIRVTEVAAAFNPLTWHLVYGRAWERLQN
jgi:hypothetical protein